MFVICWIAKKVKLKIYSICWFMLVLMNGLSNYNACLGCMKHGRYFSWNTNELIKICLRAASEKTRWKILARNKREEIGRACAVCCQLSPVSRHRPAITLSLSPQSCINTPVALLLTATPLHSWRDSLKNQPELRPAKKQRHGLSNCTSPLAGCHLRWLCIR